MKSLTGLAPGPLDTAIFVTAGLLHIVIFCLGFEFARHLAGRRYYETRWGWWLGFLSFLITACWMASGLWFMIRSVSIW